MKKKKKIKTRGSPSVSVLEGVACAPPYFLDIKSFTATAYPTQKRTKHLNSKYISNTKIRIRKRYMTEYPTFLVIFGLSHARDAFSEWSLKNKSE